MFSSLKIGTRLAGGFAIVLLLTVVMGLIADISGDQLAENTVKLYRHPFAVTNALSDANANVIGMHRSMKDVALAKDAADLDKAVADVDQREKRVYEQMALARERFLGDKAEMDAAVAAFAAWKPIRDEVIRLFREGRRDEAATITKTAGAAQVKDVGARLQGLKDVAFAKAEAFIRAAENDNHKFELVMRSTAAAAMLVGILVAVLITRGITGPVNALRGAMEGLARGQLDQDIPALERGDEIGGMAATVQVFKQNAVDKHHAELAEHQRIEDERSAQDEQRRREDIISAEMAAVIDAVADGELAKRLDLAGKDGTYRTMCAGINRLTDTIATVVADLSNVVSGLADGDLSRRVEKQYRGAFRKVAEDFNSTAAKLAGIVTRINQATSAIANASAEVAAGSTDLAERSEQQASALEETAASMEELAATVRQNATNAQQANQLAASAREIAAGGGQVVGDAVAAMGRIEASSRKIGDIVGMMDEIAFQTNLLALNAAVEAARAGDAGKGFAVVAQEVRNLAQRSAQASKEIKGLIAVSSSEVNIGAELVKASGRTLEDILSGVGKVADIVGEIAAASVEQASGIDQVNAAVSQMDEMTQQNAALVEESTAAAQSMSDEAKELGNLMSFFTIDPIQAANSLNRHIALIEATKIDHLNFMKRVNDAVSGVEAVEASGLADHHNCRLGKWYDAMNVPVVRNSTHFAALEAPHAKVHEAGKRALTLKAAGDLAGMRQAVAEMEQASQKVMAGIDRLAAELRDSEAKRRAAEANQGAVMAVRKPARAR